MSFSVKLGLLALVSTAAAVPHYGHAKYHASYTPWATGAPYPVSSTNSTVLPTGTRVSSGSEMYTTIVETLYSTQTLVSTIYAAHSKLSPSVAVADVSTGLAVCGPETVYVTTTNKVTVTVSASTASSSSTSTSSAAKVPSETPEVPMYSASNVPSYSPSKSNNVPVHSSASIQPSSSAAAEKPSSQPPQYSPAPTSEAIASSQSPYETPAYSAAPESSTSVSSSTPAPSTSSSSGYSGSKRGLAYNEAGLCSSFSGSKFGFAYNWASTQGKALPAGIKYIPMMHKPADASPEQWLANVETAVKGGSNAVMGFNEPDHDQQANLSPEQACKDWVQYMNPIASSHPDVHIIGPSVTNGPAPMGLAWLSSFDKSCPQAIYHATNIHFYDIYDDEVVNRFKAQVEKAASSYGGKPVWVTEFGLNPGSATSEQAATFLKQVMTYMDASPSVQGYSYFMVGTGENQLNTANGLSATGEVYTS